MGEITLPAGEHQITGPDRGKLEYLIQEVFGRECYHVPGLAPLLMAGSAPPCDLVALVSEYTSSWCARGYQSGGRPVIVDGGANVGVASSYLLQQHPHAQILAIEPNPEAYHHLETNLVRWGGGQVLGLNAALARRGTETLTLHSSESPASLRTSSWTHRNSWTRSFEAPGFSLAVLLEQTPVALLKLDIEGGEYDVLIELHEQELLGRIGALTLEYHHYPERDEGRLEHLLSVLYEAGFALKRQDDPVIDNYHDVLLRGIRRKGH